MTKGNKKSDSVVSKEAISAEFHDRKKKKEEGGREALKGDLSFSLFLSLSSLPLLFFFYREVLQGCSALCRCVWCSTAWCNAASSASSWCSSTGLTTCPSNEEEAA